MSGCFVFPDRARLDFHMKTEAGVDVHRTIALFGDKLQQRSRRVSLVTGSNRPLARLSFELNRAVLTWPLGFDWEETGERERRAAVHELACCKNLPPIGRLVAKLDPTGRLASIQAYRGQRALETRTVLEWGETRGRAHPTLVEVTAGGKPIMEERLNEYRVNSRFLDTFFELDDPPGGARPVLTGPMRVLERPLIAVSVRRETLEAGSSWDQARAQAARIRATFEKEGLELDLQPTFELSAAGAPVAFLAQLKKASEDPPEGWRTLPERPGYLLLVSGPEAVGQGQIRALRRALPKGAEPGPVRVKVLAEGRGAVAMLSAVRR